VPAIHRAHRPADDEPREQIQNHRQIELAAGADDEVGGVADPALIWGCRLELPVEQIARHRLIVIAHCRVLVRLADPRSQAFFLHYPHDALTAHTLPQLDQILVDARAAISAFRKVSTKPGQAYISPVITVTVRSAEFAHCAGGLRRWSWSTLLPLRVDLAVSLISLVMTLSAPESPCSRGRRLALYDPRTPTARS
jgi:hypothetical protein